MNFVSSFFSFLSLSAREVELAKDAKKGLESKEDIHGASKGLRVTEKNKKTGVGTEKTNPYDGVKDVMFFHIKGSSPKNFFFLLAAFQKLIQTIPPLVWRISLFSLIKTPRISILVGLTPWISS